jgi:hypothetical protein
MTLRFSTYGAILQQQVCYFSVDGEPFSTALLISIGAAMATPANAVVKQCAGGDDGLATDDFIADPRNSLDPGALQCTGSGDPSTCLRRRSMQ